MTANEHLKKAFHDEVDSHPEAKDYLWLGVMVVTDDPFPRHVGTLTSRTPYVLVHDSLWGFYRCRPIESGNFAELEREAAQALHGLLVYLAELPFKGLYLRLFGDASRIHLADHPLNLPLIETSVRLLDGENLHADLIQHHVRQGEDISWLQTLLIQPGNFYVVEAVDGQHF
ncbi:MAG: hypothetical protein M1493_02715 [Firmicutes bacterium]|jgi:hypothetical protein|uniref:Uncharacterized protein n=1 Tax=Sulfobacillus benefaciens TaxID=453960 RepID=A0A2T2WG85_9FIRM|nr:hypothetical protein [Bacillota bacterium]PSR21230.1 MAG: hypothetical protein C7B43_21415 [Sulfobacillus benefaciens]